MQLNNSDGTIHLIPDLLMETFPVSSKTSHGSSTWDKVLKYYFEFSLLVASVLLTFIATGVGASEFFLVPVVYQVPGIHDSLTHIFSPYPLASWRNLLKLHFHSMERSTSCSLGEFPELLVFPSTFSIVCYYCSLLELFHEDSKFSSQAGFHISNIHYASRRL